MVIHHMEVGRRVTRWTAEVHALAAMSLNRMSLKLIHPPVCVCVYEEGCVISALLFLVQTPIISLVTLAHALKHTFIGAVVQLGA